MSGTRANVTTGGNNMSIGYLYVTRNDVDGWAYVGQSRQLDPRAVETYLGSGDYLKRAMAEIGAEHFQKRILGYYDDESDLDYAELLLIAEMRAAGVDLYNGGVGGPRAHSQFIRSMIGAYGVVPTLFQEWHQAIKAHPAEVKAMLAEGDNISTDDFYRELEAQFLQTQDLTSPCPSCGAEVGAICRTKTGNPSKNHARRGR